MTQGKVTVSTAGRAGARWRQELRRSNAAVPIPMGKHKQSRSMQRQTMKEEHR